MTHAANSNMSTSIHWPLYAARDVSMASPRFWLWTLAIGLTFFSVDQDMRSLEGASWDEQVYSANEFAERISGGNVLRQAMFLSLGLLGAYGLMSGAGRSLDWRDPLLLASAAFVVWCLLSILWSTDPAQSLRRGILLVCVYAACLGFVRQFSPRDFLRMTFIITLAWFVFSCGLELALGRFQPGTENYRFRGMLHPNFQAVHCAVLGLASIAILSGAARRDWFVRCTLLVAGTAFLLARSRTALVALIVTLFVLWVARPGVRRLPWTIAFVLAISGAALVAGFVGPEVEQQISDTLLLGRSEDAGSLTGRLPLWTTLTDFALERPITGYGYGAFWSPERSESVADAIYVRGWLIPHAHSSYLDALLALGIVGAGALVLTMVLALVRAARRYYRAPGAAHMFLLSLLTFGAVNGLAESSIIDPTFFYFLTLCAVLQLTFPQDTEFSSQAQTPA